MVLSDIVEKEVLEILDTTAKVVEKTQSFKVDPKNYREWRISILSVAKLVQDQYNHIKTKEIK